MSARERVRFFCDQEVNTVSRGSSLPKRIKKKFNWLAIASPMFVSSVRWVEETFSDFDETRVSCMCFVSFDQKITFSTTIYMREAVLPNLIYHSSCHVKKSNSKTISMIKNH